MIQNGILVFVQPHSVLDGPSIYEGLIEEQVDIICFDSAGEAMEKFFTEACREDLLRRVRLYLAGTGGDELAEAILAAYSEAEIIKVEVTSTDTVEHPEALLWDIFRDQRMKESGG